MCLGICVEMRQLIFGEPRKLITENLEQETYPEYQQVTNSDPPHYEFLWGPRAQAETGKMRVLEFLLRPWLSCAIMKRFCEMRREPEAEL